MIVRHGPRARLIPEHDGQERIDRGHANVLLHGVRREIVAQP
jgi:hypothetical protein